MDQARIASLLTSFLGDERLNEHQLAQIQTYLDLLLRWNARINLTAVRDPEEVITRHFGESLFAARHLLPRDASADASKPLPSAAFEHPQSSPLMETPGGFPENGPRHEPGVAASGAVDRHPQPVPETESHSGFRISDVGSGGGFPGLPLKIYAPNVQLTLIEAQSKKATFLKEVVRALTFTSTYVNVFTGRAETFDRPADLVTMRAVEHFTKALPIAAALVAHGGRLALLIGAKQVAESEGLISTLKWETPRPVPLSDERVLLVGQKPRQQESGK